MRQPIQDFLYGEKKSWVHWAIATTWTITAFLQASYLSNKGGGQSTQSEREISLLITIDVPIFKQNLQITVTSNSRK